MKLKFLFILLLSFSAFAQSKTDLNAKFMAYVQQKSETLEGDVEKDFRDFSVLKLSEGDLSLVQNALLTLVKFDKEDPSRTSVQVLGPSYSKNSKLFQKAIQIIRNSDNAAVLKEIEEILKTSSGGNG